MQLYIRKGTFIYYCRFRYKGVEVRRSCDTPDRRLAKQRAKAIYEDYVTKVTLGQSTSVAENRDPQLSEVIALYERYVEESDRAPRLSTAKACVSSFKRLKKMLKVRTLSEMASAIQDHSYKKEVKRRERQGLSPLSRGGWVSMIRSSAALFSRNACMFYKRQGVIIENPLKGYIPPPVIERFAAPEGGLNFVQQLFEAAERDLKGHPQIYPIFLLCLGAGLRAQEAAYMRWCDIRENGIYVRSDIVHMTKSGNTRIIPVGNSLRERLLSLRPSDYSPTALIIPDLRPGRAITSPTYRNRCSYAMKKLSHWLQENGVTKDVATNPIHYLRKLFGATVLTKYPNGLQLAKKYLGHSTTDITERIYVDILEMPEVDVLPELVLEDYKT